MNYTFLIVALTICDWVPIFLFMLQQPSWHELRACTSSEHNFFLTVTLTHSREATRTNWVSSVPLRSSACSPPCRYTSTPSPACWSWRGAQGARGTGERPGRQWAGGGWGWDQGHWGHLWKAGRWTTLAWSAFRWRRPWACPHCHWMRLRKTARGSKLFCWVCNVLRPVHSMMHNRVQ